MNLSKFGILVFLGGCSYGILSTFVKLAYGNGFIINEVLGSQFFFGVLFIWLIALFMKDKRIRVKNVFILLVCGTTMGLTGLFYYQSLQYIDASIAIILLFQFTWIGIILDTVFNKVKIDRVKVIAVCILLLGSVLASGLLGVHEATFSFIGTIWGLLSAVSFATFIFVSGRLATSVHPIVKSAFMSTGGAIFILLLFPPTFLVDGTLTEGLWIYGAVLGFFGVFLPPILFNVGMPKVGSGLGTILSASELPTAVLMSLFVLKEVVTLVQWIGVIIILLGIA
ncbi:MAG TPA: DMT family transporter, partial [Bacilli bacterium]|nr:DMT family transporter [Bacilli bacterium]